MPTPPDAHSNTVNNQNRTLVPQTLHNADNKTAKDSQGNENVKQLFSNARKQWILHSIKQNKNIPTQMKVHSFYFSWNCCKTCCSTTRLRSSSSDDVIIPTTRLVTVGDRAFTAAGSRLWNSLPPDIISAQTLPVFCNRLKTYLFSKCFPS